MKTELARIEHVLARIQDLADELQVDPDGHVRRSMSELRDAFSARQAIEPAVARVLDSVRMLRTGNRDGARREFRRRAHGVDHLERVIDRELLPELRRVGFNV